MLSMLTALLLSGAPPVAEADKLARAASWDALYEQFGAANPSDYSPDEQRRLGNVWAMGCQNLLAGDAAMAFTFGERAHAFGVAWGTNCYAKAAELLGQPEVAERVLADAIASHPSDVTLTFELARRVAVSSPERARALLARLPPEAGKDLRVRQLSERLARTAVLPRTPDDLERRLAAAVEEAQRLDREAAATPSPPSGSRSGFRDPRKVDVNQTAHVISSQRSAPTLVYVYASWCGACKTAFPTVHRLASEQQGRGLQVVGLSIDGDERALRKYLELQPEAPAFETYQLVRENTARLNAELRSRKITNYRGSIPFFAILDRDGEVVAQLTGFNEAELKSGVERAFTAR